MHLEQAVELVRSQGCFAVISGDSDEAQEKFLAGGDSDVAISTAAQLRRLAALEKAVSFRPPTSPDVGGCRDHRVHVVVFGVADVEERLGVVGYLVDGLARLDAAEVEGAVPVVRRCGREVRLECEIVGDERLDGLIRAAPWAVLPAR
jgi:hypothetical protein